MLWDFKSQKQLPPILYLQLDNTSRENKKFILEFCTILLQFGNFKKSKKIASACVYIIGVYILLHGLHFLCIDHRSVLKLIILMYVRINFIPVGHMHEYIDHLLSRVASQLQRKGAESLPCNILYIN